MDQLREPSAEHSSVSLWRVADFHLDQVISLLQTTVTTDSQLSHPSELIPGSTIGKHLRHTHQHLQLLLDALLLASSPPGAAIHLSYDTRTRNLESETSHAAALESFRDLRRRLAVETREGSAVAGGRKVWLEAVTPEKVGLESTWARELWFTCLHATHHFALLRVIAVGELHLTVPPSFGVAPSTLVYRSSTPSSPPKL